MNYNYIIEAFLALALAGTIFSYYRFRVKSKAEIQSLEARLATFNIPRSGIVARWERPLESSSSYTLNIYNDTLNKVFNLSLEPPATFRACSEINVPEKMLDAGKELKVYFFPKRREFVHMWLSEGLRPIEFTLSYTETPELSDVKQVKAILHVENTAYHLRQQLRGS